MANFKVTPLEVRFFAKVEKTDSCWNWTACTNDNGYGLIWVYEAQTKLYAHRVSYEIHVGPIPEGLHIDHLCRNRGCVNPDHLEPVTGAENNRRVAVLRTHCPQGHPYDGDNVCIYRGHRRCRACDRERHRRTATERIDLAAFAASRVDNHTEDGAL